MFRDIFNKGKCIAGFHTGEWHYASEQQCLETRVCELCKNESTRTEHPWGEWELQTPNRCDLLRVCGRCHQEDTDVDHIWERWEYQYVNDCTQQQYCSRCGEGSSATRTSHSWGGWQYEEEYRTPVHTCLRCNERASSFAWQYVPSQPQPPIPISSVPSVSFKPVDDANPMHSEPEANDFATGDVEDLMHLLKNGDSDTRKAFLEQCPPASMKETALIAATSPMLDTALMGINMLADVYSRGVDPELGIRMGKAVYLLSLAEFDEDSSRTHLTNVGRSAVNIAIGLNALGRHEDILAITSEAVQWLSDHSYTDNIPPLTLYSIEANLDLRRFDDAELLLDAAGWQSYITSDMPGDRQRLQDLRRRFEQTVRQKATDLPTEAQSDKDVILGMREQMLESLRSMGDLGSSPEDTDLIKTFADMLEPELEKDMPENLKEWFLQSQGTMDTLTDFISGGDGEFNQLQNQKVIRNAVSIFADPQKERDPEAINQSLAILIEAREWARDHDMTDDENNALWGIYLCYSRTDRDSQAIEAVQSLRSNLEAIRSNISDPLQRAGVMSGSPHLFGALCHLLCRNGRSAELLEAMEGAKGRVLADVLTARQGGIVPDVVFSDPTSLMPDLMQSLGAHYLSYFVDDEEIYAVLVAKDGSLHSQSIPIDRQTLTDMAEAEKVNPSYWGKQTGGLMGRVIEEITDQLGPLVSWLEPLVDSGLIEQDDHICYNADDALHLIPLNYVTFRGKPLVRFVSLSRIQSAAALLSLMKQPRSAIEKFRAVSVPVKQDMDNPEKVARMSLLSDWLASTSLQGESLHDEGAEVDEITALEWRNLLVHFTTHGTFPRRSLKEREANPYTGSGLLLYRYGERPSLELVNSGKGDHFLLTPEKVIGLDFTGSHVTLEACVSGLAREGIGGDALGLEWACLLAGANSLMATHWEVASETSSEFNLRFYEKWLLGNSSRAEAWRQTIRELADDPRFADPYHWAAFSLSGDWR